MVDTDVWRFLESLKFRPETYRTILGDAYNNKSTDTNNLRKKLSKFVRQGLIMCGLLDGAEGVKIYFHYEKDYVILIVHNDISRRFDYYYCSKVDYGEDTSMALLFNAFMLETSKWVPLGNVTIPIVKILRAF